MRKTFLIPLAAAGIALSAPALAAPNSYYSGPGYPPPTAAEIGAGAVGGTVVGLGITEGWWGASTTAAVSTGGAAAIGGVAGIGTVAAIDSVIQPCAGVHALFGLNREACVNGQYVGYPPPRRVIHRRG